MEKKNENSCSETDSTLILYLYGESPEPAAFEAHLEKCAECRAQLAEHRKTLGQYRDLPVPPIYIDAKAAVLKANDKSFWMRTRFLMPLAGMAIAALLIFSFYLPTFLSNSNRLPITEIKMNDSAASIRTVTADVSSAAESISNSRDLESVAQLDDMISELDDIAEGLSSF